MRAEVQAAERRLEELQAAALVAEATLQQQHHYQRQQRQRQEAQDAAAPPGWAGDDALHTAAPHQRQLFQTPAAAASATGAMPPPPPSSSLPTGAAGRQRSAMGRPRREEARCFLNVPPVASIDLSITRAGHAQASRQALALLQQEVDALQASLLSSEGRRRAAEALAQDLQLQLQAAQHHQHQLSAAAAAAVGTPGRHGGATHLLAQVRCCFRHGFLVWRSCAAAPVTPASWPWVTNVALAWVGAPSRKDHTHAHPCPLHPAQIKPLRPVPSALVPQPNTNHKRVQVEELQAELDASQRLAAHHKARAAAHQQELAAAEEALAAEKAHALRLRQQLAEARAAGAGGAGGGGVGAAALTPRAAGAERAAQRIALEEVEESRQALRKLQAQVRKGRCGEVPVAAPFLSTLQPAP